MIKVKRYFDINGLKVNPKKTQVIFFGSRQNIAKIPADLRINFDGNLIEPSKQVKNLGIIFDNYMAFDGHIDYLYRNTIGTLLFLNHLKNKLDKDTRIMLTQSLALSKVNYCFKIWGSAGKSQMQKVQKLQNFASKIAIGNVRKYDRATPCLNKLKWLKMEEKYRYELCVFMYKIVNKLIPGTLLPLTPVYRVSQATTRQSNDFYIPVNRTNTGGRELAKSCPRLWNCLPREIREVRTLRSFQRNLKEHMLSSRE